MSNQPEKFTVSYLGREVPVEIHHPAGQTIYRVLFPDMQPLVMHRAQRANSDYFWTSIPEGRQKLAEEVGPLIEEYIKKHS